MTLTVVDKHRPRNYSSFVTNGGVVLCDDQDGAFLVLRFPEDLERLRALLAAIEVHTADSFTASHP